MKEEIVKAFDIIIEQQRNADSKSNLFIVLITAFLSFLSTIDISDKLSEYECSVILLWLLIIPLFLLIISLLPVYNSSFVFKKKRKKVKSVNIFYWENIVDIESNDEFIELFMKQYNEISLTEAERNLLVQIKTNSNILHRKAFYQKIAFYVLGQVFILVFTTLADRKSVV